LIMSTNLNYFKELCYFVVLIGEMNQWKGGMSILQISCHKYNLKPSLVQYIYPISYKIAKKANLRKGICPY
ncbi:MAG: hypothetical protein WBB70_02285, partial [Desulfobacterales bacterium]